MISRDQLDDASYAFEQHGKEPEADALDVSTGVVNQTVFARPEQEPSEDSISESMVEDIGIQVTETQEAGVLVLQGNEGELISEKPPTERATEEPTLASALTPLPAEETPVEVTLPEESHGVIAVQTSSKTLGQVAKLDKSHLNSESASNHRVSRAKNRTVMLEEKVTRELGPKANMANASQQVNAVSGNASSA